MPNRNYRRGYALENKIANEMREKGFFVIRSSGSHTPIDVIASFSNGDGTHTTLAIQCKSGTSPFTGKDGSELIQWANAFNAKPILIQKNEFGILWYLLDKGKFIGVHLNDFIRVKLYDSQEFKKNSLGRRGISSIR